MHMPSRAAGSIHAYAAQDATYTTCGPGNDAWFLDVGKMNLDYGRDLGEAVPVGEREVSLQPHEAKELAFPWNPGGATPITVNGCLSSRMVRPTTPRSS